MNKTISQSKHKEVSARPKYIYGLGGLAELLGCSKSTAHKVKNSGQIPFGKVGNKFIFNEANVMAAISQNGKEVLSDCQ